MQALKLTLYGTSACHLCEQAATILRELQTSLSTKYDTSFEEIDIVDDEALYRRYQTSIPVCMIQTSQHELAFNWPFDADKILAQLSAIQVNS